MHRNARFILGKKRFVKEMISFSPDIVLSTHAHLNHGFFFDITQNAYIKKKPKFVIYCGELDKGVGFLATG